MSGPPRFPLTYRTSASGRSSAAYVGNVRVGYCDERSSNRWTWQLILLQPSGGAYLGRADTEDDAKLLLEMSFHHWMTEAGLQPTPPLRANPAQPKTKETTDDQRRDQAPRRPATRSRREEQPAAGSGKRRSPARKPPAKSK